MKQCSAFMLIAYFLWHACIVVMVFCASESLWVIPLIIDASRYEFKRTIQKRSQFDITSFAIIF